MDIKSCNNCICQNLCKAYIECLDMIKIFDKVNGEIVKIPFKAEMLAIDCDNFLTPSDVKIDLLERRKRNFQ